MSVHLQRQARNQILFREVNERVLEVLGDQAGPTEFVCECSNEACIETIALDVGEYEAIRSHPDGFVVAPGHELLELEQVAEANDRFVLVRKTVDRRYAIKSDPRSRD